MLKELIEAGILITSTHQCSDCVSPHGSDLSPKMTYCVICSLKHRVKYPNHHLQAIVSKRTL